jgi:hypothetical protein
VVTTQPVNPATQTAGAGKVVPIKNVPANPPVAEPAPASPPFPATPPLPPLKMVPPLKMAPPPPMLSAKTSALLGTLEARIAAAARHIARVKVGRHNNGKRRSLRCDQNVKILIGIRVESRTTSNKHALIASTNVFYA